MKTMTSIEQRRSANRDGHKTAARPTHRNDSDVSGRTAHRLRRRALSMPEIAIIAGTRAALGAGVALLLAGKLSRERRKAVGWTLVSVGVITTIPILFQLLGSPDELPSRKVTLSHS
jgi:hypothetical protein